MSVDLATVKRVARLARIAVTEEEAERMTGELNGILGFVEQLSEVDVEGIEHPGQGLNHPVVGSGTGLVR